MANYMRNVNGIRIEMTNEEHAARVAEEEAFDDTKPARKFVKLRMERIRRLKETDFYANSDVTMSDEMKAYRKALRDFPATFNNTTILKYPDRITWPTKP